MYRLRSVGMALVVTLTLLFGIAVMSPLVGEALAQGVTNFTSVTVSNDLIAGDDITAGDDVNASGDVTVGDFATLTRQTPIAVTNGSTITPLGSYQPITSTGTAGTASIVTTTMTAGDLLMLVNETNTTITISDTADLLIGGNRALGQNDTLLLIHDGDDWVELSFTNN